MPPGVEDTTETSTLPRLPVAIKLRISSRRSSTKSFGVSVIWALPAAPVASARKTAAIDLVIGPGQVVRAATVAIFAAPVDCRPAAGDAARAPFDQIKSSRRFRGNDDQTSLDALTPCAGGRRGRREA